MNKNPSLNDNKSLEESLKGGYNHPRQKIEMTEKQLKMIQDCLKKDPILVIDLNTLKLRPSKYE